MKRHLPRLQAYFIVLETVVEFIVLVGGATAALARRPAFALDLGDQGAYVNCGQAAELGLATFTLETWFRRDGEGRTTTVGNMDWGGIEAVPLIAKGREGTDGTHFDMNYFLGIHYTYGTPFGDFEEGDGGSSPGWNHPLNGEHVLALGVWYHAAATYDGSYLRLYLNGLLHRELPVNEPAQEFSIPPLGLGTALSSNGTPEGSFAGAMDEVRVWNYARTGAEIAAAMNARITAAPGLVARWAFDEGAGAIVHDSAGSGLDGVIVGTGWSWTASAPFDLQIEEPPSAPAPITPEDGAGDQPPGVELGVTATDPNGQPLMVTFHGRPVPATPEEPFSVILLPDTQYYISRRFGGTPAQFSAQTRWIVDNPTGRDIVFVAHLGDVVQNGDDIPSQWADAWTAVSLLEDVHLTNLPQGLPYSLDVGNHDQHAAGDPESPNDGYNQYFGVSHFTGRDYYGGHYAEDNDSRFSLFSAAGNDFLVLSMEFEPGVPRPGVVAWADSVIAAHPDRWTILSSHGLLTMGNPADFLTMGRSIYEQLGYHPNLFLMVCGHLAGEGRRRDVAGNHAVWSVLADYQARTNGGNGWLRIIDFELARGIMRHTTYSPTLDLFETDPDSSSRFTLPLCGPGGWRELGEVCDVPDGGIATVQWTGLDVATEYEWFATVSDGSHLTIGPVRRFTTCAEDPCGVVDGAPDGGNPPRFALYPSIPNPFNPQTSIAFEVPRQEMVTLQVFDLSGRLVRSLIEGETHTPGRHGVVWNGRDYAGRQVASGTYFYRLEAGEFIETKRMVLVK